MRRVVPFLLAFLLLSLPAFADALAVRMEIPGITSDTDAGVEQAMKALYAAEGSADFDGALAAVTKMADDGNAEAAFRLGRYYDVETPVPDYARAAAFYGKAIEKGHGWAMNNLGVFYERGNGVEMDIEKAGKLYEAAAKAGDHHGYLNIAHMNFEGIGMPQSFDKGMAWLNEAMDKKIIGAYMDTASVFRGGFFGIPENRALGLSYLQKAANLGDMEAAAHVANIYLNGDCAPDAGLVAHLRGSPRCIPENPRKGISLFEALADRGSKEGLNSLGMAYWHGVGVEQSPQQAVSYWERAADLGNCHSFVNLAAAYEGGKGIAKDDAKTVDYLQQAVACNPRDAVSLYKLGKYYYAASGAEKDCAKAEKFFQRAVANGKREAYTDLGFLYDKGCAPITADKKKAFGYYVTGAKLNVSLCQNNAGAMLKHGWGVGKDLIKAYAWLQVAAGNGSNNAKKSLLEFDYLFQKQNRLDGMQYVAKIKRMITDAAQDPAVAFDGAY